MPGPLHRCGDGEGHVVGKLMIRLGAECGLRRGEIARVHSDDVVADSAGRSLIVRGKGDKQRVMPFGAPATRPCVIGWNMAVPYYAVTCRTTRSFWDRRAGGSVNVWCARWCTTGHGRPACLTSVRMRCATVRRPICVDGGADLRGGAGDARAFLLENYTTLYARLHRAAQEPLRTGLSAGMTTMWTLVNKLSKD